VPPSSGLKNKPRENASGGLLLYSANRRGALLQNIYKLLPDHTVLLPRMEYVLFIDTAMRFSNFLFLSPIFLLLPHKDSVPQARSYFKEF
jgi:hypothetical protein